MFTAVPSAKARVPAKDVESEYCPKTVEPKLCAMNEIMIRLENRLVTWKAIPKNELFIIPVPVRNK